MFCFVVSNTYGGNHDITIYSFFLVTVEVEILQWHVEEGQTVAQFDKLLEVQSDKATVDITSRYDGVIRKLYYKVGEMAKTGKPLLDIEISSHPNLPSQAASIATAVEKTPSSSPPSSTTNAPSAVSSATGSEGKAKGLAAPAVRHLAKQHNLTVDSIHGTGKDGRVTKEDILKVIQNGGTTTPSSTNGKNVTSSTAASVTTSFGKAGSTSEATTISSTSKAVPSVIPPPLPIPSGGTVIPADNRQPIRGLQRIMVKSMTQAWDVPHFGYCDEIMMDKLIELRHSLKHTATTKQMKLTFLPFLIKAISLALTEYPTLNSSLSNDQQELIIRGVHNIGIAMDTPRGLIVPNVKSVQNRSIWDIAYELNRLQLLASNGKLGENELSDTTFSLSNIGTIGGTYASPVIPVPNVAIGALGRLMKVPRYASTGTTDTIVPVHIMPVSWAADHRVIDGATMARFSNAWKGYLEQPSTMLAQLR